MEAAYLAVARFRKPHGLKGEAVCWVLTDEPEQDLALELGDVLFVLLVIANEQGIDLEETLERVLEKYRNRDGGRWTPVEAP